MGNQAASIQSPQRLRAAGIAALVPFVANGSTGDVKTARLAGEALLDDYNAATPRELQLATQIIARGYAAMACLRAALAARNLSLDDMLRLQDNAIALDRAAQKDTRALGARRRERANDPNAMTVENTRWDEGLFQLTINQALERLIDANARLAIYMATLAPVVPKLPFQHAEQMTPSVLARRARGQ
jgi:hypothetical protein